MKKKRRKKSKRNDRRQGKLPFARAARARRACGCSGKCCRAAGTKCACRCHGRNHGAKVVYRNPPGGAARKAPSIPVGVIGRVESITYTRGGRRWRHAVEGNARLLAPKGGGAYVVIDGIKASRFLEG